MLPRNFDEQAATATPGKDGWAGELTGDLVANLQSFGVRMDDEGATARVRRGGAGPSDHVALTTAIGTVMVPVLSEAARSSPYRLRVLGSEDAGDSALVEYEGTALAHATIVRRPKFYALTTSDGIPYWQIALLHAKNVLASTVLQSCTRYVDPAKACRFCAIGDSLRAGRTLARKTPAQLAEVAAAAKTLDGVEQVVLTTGTPATSDRGAAHLAGCAEAIVRASGLPTQVQCEPPEDFSWFRRLSDAGADAIGLHLEAVDPEVRQRVMPGKAEVSVAFYFEAFAAAVAVFGRGNVSTYLIVGLGDSQKTLIDTAERLIGMGVYPFLVPFVPLRGTPMQSHPPPQSPFIQEIYRQVGRLLAAHRLASKDTKAGCAKCGACSALSAYERPNA
jgi:radical SAM protein (TIGR04043 family)